MPGIFSNGPERIQLETIWYSRVKQARERYYAAAKNTSAAVEERQNSLLSSPDGVFVVRQAARVEAAALREYGRLLKIFRGLVADGKVPPPE
jgi:hypothetical protein